MTFSGGHQGIRSVGGVALALLIAFTTLLPGNQPVPVQAQAQADPGWIAYSDAGIWIMRPDGGERLQLMAAPPAGMWSDAGLIAWSHDGAMLAWNGPTDLAPALDEVRGIWVYRDGQAFLLPNTEACAYPAFSADNQRLLYSCWGATLGTPSEAQLASDPRMGFVSSSNLDGTDQRIEISYLDAPPAGTWTDLRGAYFPGERISVNPSDGAMLISYTADLEQPAGIRSTGGVMLFDADVAPILHEPTIYNETMQVSTGLYDRFVGQFGPMRWSTCLNLCANGDYAMLTDLDGAPISAPGIEASLNFRDFAVSPDGQQVIDWHGLNGTAFLSPDGSFGNYTGFEQKLAWQPVPAPVGRPTGPPVVLEADPASSQQPAADEPAASPAAPAADAPAPPSSNLPLGAGWVASVAPEGGDLGGALLLTRPDGGEQVVLTDTLPYGSFESPAWSADGSLLTFAGPTFHGEATVPYSGIWVLQDGQLTQFPNTGFCMNPVFSADQQRVYYHCWDIGYTDVSPADLATDPRLGIIVSSALDGTDQRAEVTAVDDLPGGSYLLPDGTPLSMTNTMVDPVTGQVLVRLGGWDASTDSWVYPLVLYTPDFTPLATGEWCPDGCANGQPYELHDLAGSSVEFSNLVPMYPMHEGPSPWNIVAEQPVPLEILLPGQVPPPAATTGDQAAEESSPPIIQRTDAEEVEAEDPAPEPDEPAAAVGLPQGAGWIASIQDAVPQSIILTRPDLSEQVVAFAGFSPDEYVPLSDLTWSHDGAMLAFTGPTTPTPEHEAFRGIWVIREGNVIQLEGTAGCSKPAFTADNLRVIYVCPGEAHLARPVEAIIMDGIEGVPVTGRYFPPNAYLGGLYSSAVTGTGHQLELAYDAFAADPAWGGLSGVLMVQSLDVNPHDGSLLLVYRDTLHESVVQGGLLLGPEMDLQAHFVTVDGYSWPILLPDGTIVTPRFCGQAGCPSGLGLELLGRDGSVLDLPLVTNVIASSWLRDFSPDLSVGVGYTYHDGGWIMSEPGVTVPMSRMDVAPQWQPVPVEIILPAA